MKFLDRNDPFFRRTWVRVVSVAVPTLWAIFEFSRAEPMWGLIFAALAAYAAYELFLRTKD